MQKIRKYKSCMRLLNRLKFRRHKLIRLHAKRLLNKIQRFPTIHREVAASPPSERQYVLRHGSQFFEASRRPPFPKSLSGRGAENFGLRKRKYRIGSYLFNVICRFPRKYVWHFPGRALLRRFFLMPFRLSLTRFISNRFISAYYRNLNQKALSGLLRIAALRRPRGFIAPDCGTAKNFGISLERTLAATVLRVSHFKAVHSIKQTRRRMKRWRRKIKLPLSNFSPSYVRQLISHKHISVCSYDLWRNAEAKAQAQTPGNGIDAPVDTFHSRKYPTKNTRMRDGNIIQINGFIGKMSENFSPREILIKNHKRTMLLRRSKDQSYLSQPPTNQSHDGSQSEGTTINDIGAPRPSDTMLNYIKALRLKRFSEIFYITYRDMHFLERMPQGVLNDSNSNIEKHVQPIYHAVGHNQSIYQGWSLISLLRVSPWKTGARLNVLRSTPNLETEKRKLQNLLRWKRFQTRFLLSDGTSPRRGHAASEMRPLKLYIPDMALHFEEMQPSKCYASLIYGTRTCKWVRLQQGSKNLFYNRIWNKTNFLESELEFFQLAHQYYQRQVPNSFLSICHYNRNIANIERTRRVPIKIFSRNQIVWLLAVMVQNRLRCIIWKLPNSKPLDE